MTSVMIVHDIDLLRGALAAVLSHQPDLEVTVQVSPTDDVVAAARTARPNVAVMHTRRCDAADLMLPHRLVTEIPECAVLVVSGRQTPDALRRVIDAGIRGFLSADAEPEALVDAVRRLADGERVIDPLLLVAALRNGKNPLNTRQRDVLRLAAEGRSAQDIGRQLFLSPGTVRNYLSAAVRQTGGRSLLEAIERARKEGWM